MEIKLGTTLVILVGPSGAGKSTWAKFNFDRNEIVSMDDIRGMICDNFLDQSQNANVANIFHTMIDARLAAGNRVVADATHLNMNHLKETINIGKKYNADINIVILDRDTESIKRTGGWRNDIKIKGTPFIDRQKQIFNSIKKDVLSLKDVTVTDDKTSIHVHHEIDEEQRKFTVIGDIHGDINELNRILGEYPEPYIFLGDLTDGTNYPDEVINKVHDLVTTGNAILIRGNHDTKLNKVLTLYKDGKTFRGSMNHGLQETFDLIKDDHEIVNKFLNLYKMGHMWLRINNSIFVHGAAHMGMFRQYGKNPSAYNLVQTATYGETNGETKNGFPVRTYDWVNKISCNVYVGHDVRSTTEPMIVKTPLGGQVTFMDTGCGKPDYKATGGHLSAMVIMA